MRWTSPSLLCAALFLAILPLSNLSAGEFYSTPGGPFRARAEISQTLVLLRCAIATGNTEEMIRCIANDYSELAGVSSGQEGISRFRDLIDSGFSRSEPHKRIVPRGRHLMGDELPPFWDFDLVHGTTTIVVPWTRAFVNCRAVMYRLSQATASGETGRGERTERDIVLELEKVGSRWRVVGSDGLIRFLENATELMERQSQD